MKIEIVGDRVTVMDLAPGTLFKCGNYCYLKTQNGYLDLNIMRHIDDTINHYLVTTHGVLKVSG